MNGFPPNFPGLVCAASTSHELGPLFLSANVSLLFLSRNHGKLLSFLPPFLRMNHGPLQQSLVKSDPSMLQFQTFVTVSPFSAQFVAQFVAKFAAQVKDAKFEEWSTAVETLEYSSETPMGEVTVTWVAVRINPNMSKSSNLWMMFMVFPIKTS